MSYRDPTEELVQEFVDKYYIFEILLFSLALGITTWFKTNPYKYSSFSNLFGEYTFGGFLGNQSEPESSEIVEANAPSIPDSYNLSRPQGPSLTHEIREALRQISSIPPRRQPSDETIMSISSTCQDEVPLPQTYLCTRSGRMYAR